MFDADLRHSIGSDRKACRDIRARCEAQLSQFRRDQRVKTGASVGIDDRISVCGLRLYGYERQQWQLLEQILIKLNRILRPGSSWRIRLAGTLGGRRRLRAGGSRRSWRLLCAGWI